MIEETSRIIKHRIRERERYRENSIAINAARKDKKNDPIYRAKIKEKSKIYYEKNKEILSKKNKDYRSRPENRENAKQESALWYRKNTARAKAAMRLWYSKNPEKGRARSRIHNHIRKSRIMALEGKFSIDDVNKLYAKQDGLCTYCKSSLEKKYHIDHIIPVSKIGSSNWPSNLQLLCPSCNTSKNNKDPIEWAKSKGYTHV